MSYNRTQYYPPLGFLGYSDIFENISFAFSAVLVRYIEGIFKKIKQKYLDIFSTFSSFWSCFKII